MSHSFVAIGRLVAALVVSSLLDKTCEMLVVVVVVCSWGCEGWIDLSDGDEVHVAWGCVWSSERRGEPLTVAQRYEGARFYFVALQHRLNAKVGDLRIRTPL